MDYSSIGAFVVVVACRHVLDSGHVKRLFGVCGFARGTKLVS